MKFGDLPIEICISVTDYLSIQDIIALSQTSNDYRSFFAPLSWKTCEVTTPSPSAFFKSPRKVPIRILTSPDKYKWFLSQNVMKIHIKIYSGKVKSDILAWFKKFGTSYKTVFPNLEEVLLDYQRPEYTESRFRKIPSSPILEIVSIVGNDRAYLERNPRIIDQVRSIPLDSAQNDITIPLRFHGLDICCGNINLTTTPLSLRNFSHHGLDYISLSVFNPSLFFTVLSRMDQVSYCKTLVVRIPVFSKSNHPLTITILRCLDQVPKSVKEIRLVFQSTIKKRADGDFNLTSLPKHVTDMTHKLVLDRVVSFKGYWLGLSSIFVTLEFPNLSSLILSDNLYRVPKATLLPKHVITISESITDLKWYPASKINLYQSISKFVNLRHFSIFTNLSHNKKWPNYDAFLNYILNPASNEEMGKSERFSTFVQATEPCQLQWIRQVIKTLLEELPPQKKQNSIESSLKKFEWPMEVDFLACLNSQLVFFALVSLPRLETVEIECNSLFIMESLLYMGLRLLRKSNSVRHVSLLAYLHYEPDKDDRGIRGYLDYGIDDGYGDVLVNRIIQKDIETMEDSDSNINLSPRHELLDSGKIVHRLVPYESPARLLLHHEFFSLEHW